MGGKSKPPPAPDYVGAANAQGAANVEAARAGAKLSNPNISSPYGSQTVTYEGDVPTVTQSLSPEEQQIFNQNQQTRLGLGGVAQQGVGNVSGVLGSQFNTNNLPSAPINPGTTAQQAMMSRLDPQIKQDRQSLESQLANQGIPLGSEAYGEAQRIQGNKENDLRLQAASQGIGLDQGARQQALSEQLGLRELPLNEITALLGSSQVQTPQFQGYQGQNVQAAPLFGATNLAGQYQSDVYNAQNASKSNMFGGLFNLGGQLGSAYMLS